MTREEFVQKHSPDMCYKLYKAFSMKEKTPIEVTWFQMQLPEINAWLGGLHDTLTELLNAPKQKQPEGKSGAAGAGGPVPKAASSRNAG